MQPLLSRRGYLRLSLGATASLCVPRWLDPELHARESATAGRSLILLWMNGGPSHLDTWDPKPGHPHGGEFAAIDTNVAGIQISEHLPQLAKQMHHLAVVRSMTSKEGSHERGRYLLQSGYLPMPGTQHPALGSILSAERGQPDQAIPNFVSISLPSIGAGLLGMEHAAFHLPNSESPPPNTALPGHVRGQRFQRRLRMLSSLERGFINTRRGKEATAHQDVYQQSIRMMQAKELAAFDVSQEKPQVRDAYGRTPFGQGCLLARRLIESGVKCVQVSLNGWDTHARNFPLTRNRMEILDPAYATLVQELDERGLLDSTLVLCLGEFGRTPKINPLGGRDHWPKTWSATLAGAGIRGGQVVGKTSPDGTQVSARPVSVPDLFATCCQALRIDADKQHLTPAGRPIRTVDSTGTPVAELIP
ncbi:MAG TPA: DUF1501 domain-containing protein [Planctomycetaceae bacterium]|nr:hypothetical protein [Blastopirellula sp.]HAY78483.1 DUF1501 domain-containing protein [Planctomycetaceae bacterium]